MKCMDTNFNFRSEAKKWYKFMRENSSTCINNLKKELCKKNMCKHTRAVDNIINTLSQFTVLPIENRILMTKNRKGFGVFEFFGNKNLKMNNCLLFDKKSICRMTECSDELKLIIKTKFKERIQEIKYCDFISFISLDVFRKKILIFNYKCLSCKGKFKGLLIFTTAITGEDAILLFIWFLIHQITKLQ